MLIVRIALGHAPKCHWPRFAQAAHRLFAPPGGAGGPKAEEPICHVHPALPPRPTPAYRSVPEGLFPTCSLLRYCDHRPSGKSPRNAVHRSGGTDISPPIRYAVPPWSQRPSAPSFAPGPMQQPSADRSYPPMRTSGPTGRTRGTASSSHCISSQIRQFGTTFGHL